MEKVVLVKSLYRNTSEYLSKEVTISGWIRTLRASNAFGFIEVNDGSFFKNIQVSFPLLLSFMISNDSIYQNTAHYSQQMHTISKENIKRRIIFFIIQHTTLIPHFHLS